METIITIVGIIITIVSSFLLGRGTKYDKSGNPGRVISDMDESISEVGNVGNNLASSAEQVGDITTGLEQTNSTINGVREELNVVHKEVATLREQSSRAEELLRELSNRLREKP